MGKKENFASDPIAKVAPFPGKSFCYNENNQYNIKNEDKKKSYTHEKKSSTVLQIFLG